MERRGASAPTAAVSAPDLLPAIRFTRDDHATLRELYPPDQLETMMAVARDAEVNARWRTATAIKGGSDTATNLGATAAKVSNTS